MVVGLRTSLRSLQHGRQTEHNTDAPPLRHPVQPTSSNLHHHHHPRTLLHRLLLPLHLSVSTLVLLLDTFPGGHDGSLYEPEHHHHGGICLFSHCDCLRLDHGDHPLVHREEFADDAQDKDHVCGYFGVGVHVSLSLSLAFSPKPSLYILFRPLVTHTYF